MKCAFAVDGWFTCERFFSLSNRLAWRGSALRDFKLRIFGAERIWASQQPDDQQSNAEKEIAAQSRLPGGWEFENRDNTIAGAL